MKYILALAATAVGLVAAQDFTGQPECAVNCLREFIPQIGCALDDTGCQCNSENQARLQPLITPCFLANCNATELSQAVTAASTACAAFLATASGGVPVSGTPTGGSSSSAAGSSSSASGTGNALSSLISSITNAASSALESATATGSESASETGSDDSSESESRSVSLSTFTSDGSTFVQTTTPTETAEEGGASSTTGGNGAAATAAPLAGMAIAAIIAAAL
ncbi:hypothetical protein F5X68DRAFT_186398 [Plectosphaerella plurivora]|uniref:CFEM domain-containing protein n=1 Tax=Plectosphaerella plurivora TaxID=936078 RepID=A0A9P8VPS5_9PEZI|nr:hypothetical protein F5X68DRAFT_186398 [Plectosphaerella plurivora]